MPVVQLSINALKPFEYHLGLGRRLATLQDRGIMVLASGNVVHNLGRLQWDQPNLAFDWAERFDDAVVQQLVQAPGDIFRLKEHADFAASVPTPDHFIPLLYLCGMAAEQQMTLEPPVRGYAMGSISMTCYGLGAEGMSCTLGQGAATVPSNVPPTKQTSDNPGLGYQSNMTTLATLSLTGRNRAYQDPNVTAHAVSASPTTAVTTSAAYCLNGVRIFSHDL